MIEITRIEEKYINGLKKMMLQENLEFNDVSLCLDTLYVVVEKLDVLGFGYYNQYDNDFFIDHLYIKTNERLGKLGDSLFRAILNSMILQGHETVYMRTDSHYDGFLQAENIEKHDDRFVVDLNEFFSRKCRSSKKETPIN